MMAIVMARGILGLKGHQQRNIFAPMIHYGYTTTAIWGSSPTLVL